MRVLVLDKRSTGLSSHLASRFLRMLAHRELFVFHYLTTLPKKIRFTIEKQTTKRDKFQHFQIVHMT